MPTSPVECERLRPITREEARVIAPIVEEEYNRIKKKLKKEEERLLLSSRRVEAGRETFRKRIRAILERIRNS